MLNSVWAETARIPAFPPLEGDTRTDVLIVGGGMAGLLCAYLLKRAGVDCLLVEAGRICGGISRNTRNVKQALAKRNTHLAAHPRDLRIFDGCEAGAIQIIAPPFS